jgi:hypothetical protein
MWQRECRASVPFRRAARRRIGHRGTVHAAAAAGRPVRALDAPLPRA